MLCFFVYFNFFWGVFCQWGEAGRCCFFSVVVFSSSVSQKPSEPCAGKINYQLSHTITQPICRTKLSTHRVPCATAQGHVSLSLSLCSSFTPMPQPIRAHAERHGEKGREGHGSGAQIKPFSVLKRALSPVLILSTVSECVPPGRTQSQHFVKNRTNNAALGLASSTPSPALPRVPL